MTYFYCIETEDDRLFFDVYADNFDEAIDLALSHSTAIQGELIAVSKSSDDLAETIYCIDNDC